MSSPDRRWVLLGGITVAALLVEQWRRTITKPTIARIWRGRTRREIADRYESYVRAEGIPQLVEKALGVQLFREDRETESEFATISCWADEAAMASFTGGDPNQVHHLPRDKEFLLELPKRIAVMRILVDQAPG